MKIKENFDLDKLFFTSDNHFWHTNILKYAHRPFETVEEQTQELVERWNEVIPEDGDVFVLGDFIHSGQIDVVRDIVGRLNGRIWWILGNHCYQNRHDRDVIKAIVGNRVMDVAEILIRETNERIFASHYPHLYWPRGCFHIHGHIHSGPNSTSSEKAPFHPLRYDVGVDNNNYYPVSYRELMNIFDEQRLKSFDEAVK